MMMTVVSMAQMKVAILETVDKAGNVSYGVKLLLRSSLTAAISNTTGYEGYDRVDMASIAGEQEFQRTGNVSDDQIQKIGQAAGASYVLVAEAARYDATSIIITAKLLDVVTFGVKSSAVLVSGISADELEESCSTLATKLFNTSLAANSMRQVPQPVPRTQSETPASPVHVPSDNVGNVGDVIVFPDQTRGIIFYKDYGVGLAVSVDEAQLSWQSTDKQEDLVDVPQIPNIDDDEKNFVAGKGATYTSAILSQFEGTGRAPAAEWCVGHGNGWYLPSAGELVCLFKANKSKTGSLINAGLAQARGRKIVAGWYWSSSEKGAKEAINVISAGCLGSGEDKNSTVRVRAVRAFSY